MAPESDKQKRVDAAHRELRNIRERLFPPTWVEALRQVKAAYLGPTGFSPPPDDLLQELLIPTPHTMHGNDPQEDFRIWFYYRHEFGKLLCLYEAMTQVVSGLCGCEEHDPEFADWSEVAARILDSKGDMDIAIICLGTAATQ